MASIEGASPVRVSEVTGMTGRGAAVDADVIAAIAIAVHEAWPKPGAAIQPTAPNVSWRFGHRRWRQRQVPRQTWGR